ncbi:hypothetical protein GE21DRAFT_8436 [Neurospora crassa]|uniref:Uncharacterized protein n=1 Tax=Neurospora crassa (strain ATCC 24698 / 74-OR23-1A / CBS 708.71 / DSM 1257 / FGSC 987) TaxID=367110 RepID=Q7RWA1_NEUCR|nr:hypothetical protein NCU07245 [Neurospora crassa OR74A]EAA26669.1 hypothetical protein NCU07245 [Neurospora crassa OR74A]KHE85718.1 hypothetical protein GE21DRAFT_8436 [Neurospora crassa]|eukprot:XP_955905.1 hypothetical protein NCU07245 [Neurospora crassa OR74A]
MGVGFLTGKSVRQQGSGIDNTNNVHQHEPLRSDRPATHNSNLAEPHTSRPCRATQHPAAQSAMTMPIPPAAMWLRIRTRSRHQDTVQLPSDRRSETTFIIFSGSAGPRRYDKPSHRHRHSSHALSPCNDKIAPILHKPECLVLIMHNQLLNCQIGIRGTKNGTYTIMVIRAKAAWARSLEHALLFSAWSENELMVELRNSSSGSQWFRRIVNELRPFS